MSDLKSQFEKGFLYSYSINKKQLEVLKTTGEDLEMMRLLSHVVWAQVIWLMRLKGEAYQGMDFWKVLGVDELEKLIEEDYEKWQEYLTTVVDLEKRIDYTNSSGQHWTNTIRDIVFHVINHGTHHRAQISMLLRQSGIAPPPVDYVFWVRE